MSFHLLPEGNLLGIERCSIDYHRFTTPLPRFVIKSNQSVGFTPSKGSLELDYRVTPFSLQPSSNNLEEIS
ncbi:MAG: hypothetical protein QW356_08625, partial [Candidatus Hadarchaeales archaeon]